MGVRNSSPIVWPRLQNHYSLNGNGEIRLYVRNPATGQYTNVASLLGINDRINRAVAVADVVGNGKESFAVANQWASSSFYQNVSQEIPHFMELRLLLPTSGPALHPAIYHGHPQIPYTTPAITAVLRIPLKGGKTVTSQMEDSGKRDGHIFVSLGSNAKPTTLYSVNLSWRGRLGKLHHSIFQLKAGFYSIVL